MKAVCYDKLLHKMIDQKRTTGHLIKQVRLSTDNITRLKQERYISLESIESIRRVMGCGVGEILEFVGTKEDSHAGA